MKSEKANYYGALTSIYELTPKLDGIDSKRKYPVVHMRS